MATATIVIGIGSTGLRIIEQAEQLHYELTGKNRPGPNVEYLFLETDENAKPRRTASGETDILPIILSGGTYPPYLAFFRDSQDIDSGWIPENAELHKDGAGGRPTMGRLALWVNRNYETFQIRLASSINRVLMGNPHQSLQVLVVGTLTGGTGSGICVDIAYLIRKQVGGTHCQVNGVFLLPGRDDITNNLPMCQNSFSALSTLELYSQNGARYSSFCPDWSGPLNLNQVPPYDMVTLLSPEFSTGKPTRIPSDDFSELVRVGGTLVALNYLDTLEETNPRFYSSVKARRIDARNHDGLGRFATAGLHVIQFPKSQLEELLAIERVEVLLKDLGMGGENDSALADVISNTKEKFEYSLEKASQVLVNTSIEGRSVMDFLIGKWEENNTLHGPNNTFLYHLFCITAPANPTNVTHRLMASSIPNLRESVVKDLQDHVEEIMQVHGKLTFAREAIKQFELSRKEHLDWSERLGVPDDSDRWNHSLQLRIEALISKSSMYAALGLANEYRKYVLEELLWAVKQHALALVLKEFNFSIVNADDARWRDLPTLDKIDSYRNAISNLLEGELAINGNEAFSFSKRRSHVHSILKDDHRCFTFLYTRGSKDNDLGAGREAYNSNPRPALKTVDLFANQSIWTSLSSKSTKELFEVTLMSALRHVQSSNVFNDANLVEIINGDLPRLTRDKVDELKKVDGPIPLKQIPAMVSLLQDVDFEAHAHVKMWVCSNNPTEVAKVINNDSEARIELPSLKNCIVLYYEYGRMLKGDLFRPTKHLAIAPLIKKNLREQVAARNGESFRILKFPYLSEQEVNEYLA